MTQLASSAPTDDLELPNVTRNFFGHLDKQTREHYYTVAETLSKDADLKAAYDEREKKAEERGERFDEPSRQAFIEAQKAYNTLFKQKLSELDTTRGYDLQSTQVRAALKEDYEEGIKGNKFFGGRKERVEFMAKIYKTEEALDDLVKAHPPAPGDLGSVNITFGAARYSLQKGYFEEARDRIERVLVTFGEKYPNLQDAAPNLPGKTIGDIKMQLVGSMAELANLLKTPLTPATKIVPASTPTQPAASQDIKGR